MRSNLSATLGRNLRQEMETRGVPQAELARAAGLSTWWSLEKILRGDAWPRPGTLERLGAALDVPLARLLGEATGTPGGQLAEENDALRTQNGLLRDHAKRVERELHVVRQLLDETKRAHEETLSQLDRLVRKQNPTRAGIAEKTDVPEGPWPWDNDGREDSADT